MRHLTLRTFLWILGFVATLGNMFVITYRTINRRENHVYSLLLTHLAFADCLMGVYMLIIASVDMFNRGKFLTVSYEWKRSGLCQFCAFLSTLSSEASVFILTAMTTDRYVGIIAR